jgi:transcriptional regulator with XRE-family HTH domain
MDIKDIRLKNLEKLIAKEESATVFANKVDISPSQLSQIRNPKYSRSVGNAAARKIEKACGLPYGWMDKLETSQEMDRDVNKFKAMQKEEDEAEHELMTYFPMLLARQQKDILDRVKAYWEENRQVFAEFERKRLKSEQ